ncbi:MAG: hypothetical protein IPP46_08050 [Bacteroidetes bacterium]|nr:hypothetical protein [Bacteroidota bacterium]
MNNGALTYILVNAVKELDEKSKKLTHALKNISDFGVTEIVSGTEVAVLFDEEFSNALQGNTPPVVSVTPLNNAVHLCVKNVHRWIYYFFGYSGSKFICELDGYC